MKEGLLWYDNDPRKALANKVADAAQAYQRKFGRRPNTCHLAPGDLRRSPPAAALRLVPSTLVRPHHFWVGVDESAARPETAAPLAQGGAQ